MLLSTTVMLYLELVSGGNNRNIVLSPVMSGAHCGPLQYILLTGPEDGEAHPLNLFPGTSILVTMPIILGKLSYHLQFISMTKWHKLKWQVTQK